MNSLTVAQQPPDSESMHAGGIASLVIGTDDPVRDIARSRRRRGSLPAASRVFPVGPGGCRASLAISSIVFLSIGVRRRGAER